MDGGGRRAGPLSGIEPSQATGPANAVSRRRRAGRRGGVRMVEPALLLVLAAVVLFVVVALLLPMLKWSLTV